MLKLLIRNGRQYIPEVFGTLCRMLPAGSNFPQKNKPSIQLKCSVVFLYKNKYRYYFAAGGGAGAAGAGAPGAGAGAPGAPGAGAGAPGAPGAGAGAAASFLAGSAGFFSGADGQPTNASVNAINISTERMKANTFFINLVPPFKNFQTLGVKPIPLAWQDTPFFHLVKLNLSNIF
ncbi:MAG: hypothetical protein ABFD82_06700 [Syntrophaceae bacterium]